MKTIITSSLLLLATLGFLKTASATELTNAEKEGLELMREEEKLAQDVYVFLYDQWGLPIFNNISNSETRHFNAVGYLLETFEIEDISLPEFGKFQNSEIAFLYDSLTQKGSESLVEALKVGAFIEEFDIADLQHLIAVNTNTIIDGVYQNLLRGSNNHLRAFSGQLESRGEVYHPIILDEVVFQQIAEAPHQRGGGANCLIPENNGVERQNSAPVRNRNRGKGRMQGQGDWN